MTAATGIQSDQALAGLLHRKRRPDRHQRWIQGLRGLGLTDAEIAEAIGVEADVVEEWHGNAYTPDRALQTALGGLANVAYSLLVNECPKADVAHWLFSPDARLGEKRPVDLLQGDSYHRVLSAACSHAIDRIWSTPPPT